jgi:uncharacterized protein (DUF58 family)
MAPPVLEPAELARLGSLEVRARVIVDGAFAGLHHTPHTGVSMEFSEHREYAPGDEVRRIDWKVAARTDRYYVKCFEDETEMRAYLVVDTSASMGYGRHLSKLGYAASLAGAVAYLLGKQGDPAGLFLFNDTVHKVLPALSRPGQLREIFQALENATPGGATIPARALGQVAETAQKRSLILFFSDLLDTETPGDLESAVVAQPLRELRGRGHDVVVFHVLDPDEVELPFDDLTCFEGMEPADTRTLLCQPSDLRAAFRKASQSFRDAWRLRCLESRVEYRFVSTRERPSDVLRAFLSGRQRLRKS